MEFEEGNTLKKLIKLQNFTKFEITQINKFTVQMVEGLYHFHELEIAHRDLKPVNIILKENGWLKFVDFGKLKEDLHSQMSYRIGRLGKFCYYVPEQFDPMLDSRGKATYKTNCWSLDI
jgi:serine/threonine protein kinase